MWGFDLKGFTKGIPFFSGNNLEQKIQENESLRKNKYK